MKLCAVQSRAVAGDIQRNIVAHRAMLDEAIAHGAEMVIFPELSLTGYEPTLARALATDQNDCRFDDFQRISDARQVTIGVGVPTRRAAGTCISMILFQPGGVRALYSKQHLHPDEEPFFVPGQGFATLRVNGAKVGLAICYELSVPEHAERAVASGADLYVASVAKSAAGVAAAAQRLSAVAAQYRLPVMMANSVGPCDTFESAGGSAVWNHEGRLVGCLDASIEGLIVYDTVSQASHVASHTSQEAR